MAEPLSQFMTGNIARGVDPNNKAAYTRTVDRANETTSGQLGQLLRGDNPILQRAARKGASLAQLRGSTGNDSIFAGAAQDAMAENLIPVAGQDAATFERASTGNMGALNESSITDRNNDTQLAAAAASSAASRYAAELGLRGDMARLQSSENQFNVQQGNWQRQFESDQAAALRQFQEGQRQYDTTQNESVRRYETDNKLREQERLQSRAWDTADRDTATRAAGRNQVFSQVAGAIFSDPTYWRDPAGASGMLNFFTQNFSGIWDSLFPPTQP